MLKQNTSLVFTCILVTPHNLIFKLIMAYFFTSESVSEGHPDKIADQISDALIDNFLAFDADSKVACETLVTTGQVILAGEVKSNTYLDVQQIARDVIKKIGYTKSEYMFDANSCGILSAIHEQSADINQGVDKENKEYDDEFATVAALEDISSLKAPEQLAALKGKEVRFNKVTSKEDMAQVVFDMLGI